MTESAPSPARLLEGIRRLRNRWRLLVLLEGAALALATVLGLFLAGATLDNWLHLPAAGRLLFLVLFLAAAAWLFTARVILPLCRPFTEEAVAVHLERQIGGLRNRIINTVQLGRCPPGERPSVLLDQVLTENTVALQKAPPLEKGLPARGAARWLVAFLLVSAVAFAYARVWPRHFENAIARLSRPLAVIQPITDTTLDVRPGHAEVPLGGVATVHIRTGGKPPARVLLRYQRGDDPAEKLELIPHAAGAYSHSFLDVRHPIRYSVAAGDARTEWFRIRPVAGPDLAAITIGYEYPEYTGMAALQQDDSRGDVLAPAGTRVTLTVKADRPLRSVIIHLPGAEPVPLGRQKAERFVWEGILERGGAYQLFLLDLRGYSNTAPIVREFKLQPDRPPSVELKADQPPPGAFTLTLTPDDSLPLRLRAEDDFGVRELTLLAWKTEGESPRPLLTVSGGKTQPLLTHTHPLRAAELGAVGETWNLQAVATDFHPDNNRPAGRSQPLRVRLVSTRERVDSTLVAVSHLKRELKELMDLQQANLTLGRSLLPNFELDRLPLWSDATFATNIMKQYEQSAAAQATIQSRAAGLAGGIQAAPFLPLRESLEQLAQREMTLATDTLARGLTEPQLPDRREKLQAAIALETVILETLQTLFEQAARLETEIALQTVLSALERILHVQQDLLSRTPPNAPIPSAEGAAALADRQKEITVWLDDLRKRLNETTAALSADKDPTAPLFGELTAALQAANLPPLMQSAESALRAAQWPAALQAQTQVVDSLKSLLAMIRRELAAAATGLARELRETLKQAPAPPPAAASLYKALASAEEAARVAAPENPSLGGKHSDVPERPLGAEMAARDLAHYLKKLQEAARQSEQARRELERSPWNDPALQQQMAASFQQERDPAEIPLSEYRLTPGKDPPRDQDWSRFENARGGPKNILDDKTPEDMQDLVGDLIEDQQRLREKMITSFLEMNTDLKDTGDVGDLDVPMGNYAMRGKTGNKMPASLHIGGRSRSGRQAPTFGELGVEKAADRKGRPGEGLNAPDQKGFVQEERVEGDPGAEPTTATGGKRAGQDGREGQIGAPRPGDAAQYQGVAAEDVIQEGRGRPEWDVSGEAWKFELANRQAQLVRRAEELTKQFEQLFTPSSDWYQGVDLMREIEEQVRRGPSDKLWQVQEQALEKLQRVHRQLSPGSPYDFDVGHHKTPNALVVHPRPEEFPARDAEALKQYYLRLAEEQ